MTAATTETAPAAPATVGDMIDGLCEVVKRNSRGNQLDQSTVVKVVEIALNHHLAMISLGQRQLPGEPVAFEGEPVEDEVVDAPEGDREDDPNVIHIPTVKEGY